jgi:phospholipase C
MGERRPGGSRLEEKMAVSDSPSRFDHVVVLMFENRSFDTLLGALYPPGGSPVFEGIAGKVLSNPVPPGALASGPASIPLHPATNMDTPDPDPGEEYPHLNTQLFGTVAPPANAGAAVDAMQPPFNAPNDPAPTPSMDGFVADYINAFRAEMGRPPTYDECAEIMGYYTPQRLPVLSALAQGFACFDHWFCEVPSQTYPNRSFFHAASSSGFVLNGPAGKFATRNDAPTIFERLESARRSWKVYIDPEQILPATGLIHARRLAPYFATHFSTIFDFYEEALSGTLPDYAFLEPNMFHPHTDMHPPGAARWRHDFHFPAPDAMAGGERLLARVYDAVRSSSSRVGSSNANTLLLVTFDEHGGTYDHVPPPKAAPPDPAAPVGEEGFRFDRSGVRIPTIAISAWVDARTVVTSEYRSTSMIRTLRERWDLGPPLTERDATAPDLAPILSRTVPRPPEDWPDVHAPPLTLLGRLVDVLDRPLERLERETIGEALAHEARVTGAPIAGDSTRMTHGEAHRHAHRIATAMFPGIVHGRRS